tara:strand:- start:452 stop:1339 length:888 start_codon:yes stop_codon:yes gene_type:complete
MKILKTIKKLINTLKDIEKYKNEIENIKFQNGSILYKQNLQKNSKNIIDYEFKVFSQWGEDGIISFLINNLEIENKFFVEFGVEDYVESNTRFLLKKNNWSGLIIDSSIKNIDFIKKDQIYWRHDIKALCEYISKKNINKILTDNTYMRNIGLLSIDIDGNDYWIWNEITSINPSIVIIEYNSLLGKDKSLVVPYKEDFNRSKEHYSNIYYGASLSALTKLANIKNYALVGCNSAGNNAFFVKKKLLNEKVQEREVDEVFQLRKFRETRNIEKKLDFLNISQQEEILSKLPFEEV